MNEAERLFLTAQLSACHSGEKAANGQNAARDGYSAPQAGRAMEGTRSVT